MSVKKTKEQLEKEEVFLDFCRLFNIKIKGKVCEMPTDKIPELLQYLSVMYGINIRKKER